MSGPPEDMVVVSIFGAKGLASLASWEANFGSLVGQSGRHTALYVRRFGSAIEQRAFAEPQCPLARTAIHKHSGWFAPGLSLAVASVSPGDFNLEMIGTPRLAGGLSGDLGAPELPEGFLAYFHLRHDARSSDAYLPTTAARVAGAGAAAGSSVTVKGSGVLDPVRMEMRQQAASVTVQRAGRVDPFRRELAQQAAAAEALARAKSLGEPNAVAAAQQMVATAQAALSEARSRYAAATQAQVDRR